MRHVTVSCDCFTSQTFIFPLLNFWSKLNMLPEFVDNMTNVTSRSYENWQRKHAPDSCWNVETDYEEVCLWRSVYAAGGDRCQTRMSTSSSDWDAMCKCWMLLLFLAVQVLGVDDVDRSVVHVKRLTFSYLLTYSVHRRSSVEPRSIAAKCLRLLYSPDSPDA